MTSSGGDALVIFHGHGNGHWLAPILKKGFSHCFCAVLEGNYWIAIDSHIDDGITIRVVAPNDYDLKEFYESHGFTVLAVKRGGAPKLPLALSNCVGLVKTALGLNHLAITPYQLYKRIIRS